MSDINMRGFDLALMALVAGAAAGLVLMALVWRAARSFRTPRRMALACIAPVVLIGIAGAFAGAHYDDDGIAPVAMTGSAFMQLLLLPVLLIFFRRKG